ncbi:MAG: FecR family protein [Treponema sp.]|jgi:hypothetical protein|nr:FecR family protein [Treponema sp.]
MTDKRNPEPQNRNREFALNLTMVLLCLSGAAFSFIMFWNDLNRTMDRFAEPIGTITYKRQAAQRRFSDRVLWTVLSTGSPVYQGDYIRTAELSQAVVHFDDGTDIDLAENTLIQIRTENGKNIVDFAEGNLSLTAGQSTRILVSGENLVEIGAGAALNAASDSSGVFSLRVQEGEITANGTSLGAGENFSTDALAVRAVPVSPGTNARFLAADGTAEARFSWNALNYSGPTKFDLALDRRFRRIEKSLVSEGESLPLSLEPGVYWWRVYPDGTPPGAAAGKITVVPPAAPELISPAGGRVLYFGGPEEQAAAGADRFRPEIRFSWKSAPLPAEIDYAENYLLELADNAGFETPFASFQVEGREGGSLVYGGLGEGLWYWRVRRLFPGIELPAAQAHFTIARTGPPSPPPAETADTGTEPEAESARTAVLPPVVSPPVVPPPVVPPPVVPPAVVPPAPLPSPSGLVPPDRFTLGPEAIRLSRQMLFEWSGVEGANSYIFSIFREGVPASASVFSAETVRPSYTLEDLGILGRGSFVWRVEAVQKNDGLIERRGTPAESRFTLDVPAPGNPRIKETGALYGL